jgi:2-phospho-L-lactate guanylyltransferase
VRVVVPYAVTRPKTRLDALLDVAERRDLAAAMCRDVVGAVRAAGGDPELLATAPTEVADVPVTVDDRPLTPAVNDVLPADEDADAVAVVMADLALATPDALARLFDAGGEVVAVPGRGGGTNALVVRHPDFRVDYHGASIRDHRRIAREAGLDYHEVDSMRLATDVDERGDLAELLLHGDGEAADWLRDAGFELAVDDGRVGVRRG